MRPLGRISQIRVNRQGAVQIPIAFYHRVALGLETGTTVHVAPVLPQKPDYDFVEELIVTTFKPEWWQDMYRLSLRMTERHGAVAVALQTIQKHGGNIAVLENVTTEAGAQGTHHILAFVYIPDAQLNNLLAELLPLVKDGHEDNLKHEHLQRLKDCYEHLNTTQPYRVVMREKKISIPATIFRSLVCTRSTGHRAIPTRTLIFSDSEEKFIQCYFPRDIDIVMIITVNHRENKGAIYSFSQAVSETGANILGSFSRLESAGDTAEWKAVIDVTNATCPVSGIISKIAQKEEFFFHFSDVTLSFINMSKGRNLNIPPFPSAETEEFIGRTAEVQEILAGIVPNGQTTRTNYIVNGFSKAGKTAILYHLYQLLESDDLKDVVSPVYVQLQGPDVKQFWQCVHNQIVEQELTDGSSSDPVRGNTRFFSSTAPNSAQVDPYQFFLAKLGQIGRPLVILVDEAQYLLHPDEENRLAANQILRQIAGLRVAHHTNSPIPPVAWVLADRDAWKQDHSLETGMRAKFAEIPLHSLTQQEGSNIATMTFKKVGLVSDHLEEVHRRIAKACNNQPFFIQMVTRRLLQFVDLAPTKVDVVDSSLIERAIQKAAREDLRSHFEDTVSSLSTMCRPDAINKLLYVGSQRKKRIPLARLLKEGFRPEDLAIFPGLVIFPKNPQRQSCVSLVELMRCWLKNRRSSV